MSEKKNTENAILDSVFYDKPIYAYVYKKVTKICRATYMVTDSIRDSEPIKRSLRAHSLNMVSLTDFTKDVNVTFKSLNEEILTLKNLFEIAKNHELLSPMNQGILDKELGDLGTTIKRETNDFGSISPDFFLVSDTRDIGGLKDTKKHSVLYKGHYKRHTEGQSQTIDTTEGDFQKDILKSDMRTVHKNDRRQQILDIIKSKDNLTIKDITEVIKDCSEKTVQRELVSMLSLGLIKKVGERRWSKYSIL